MAVTFIGRNVSNGRFILRKELQEGADEAPSATPEPLAEAIPVTGFDATGCWTIRVSDVAYPSTKPLTDFYPVGTPVMLGASDEGFQDGIVIAPTSVLRDLIETAKPRASAATLTMIATPMMASPADPGYLRLHSEDGRSYDLFYRAQDGRIVHADRFFLANAADRTVG